ncbi:hypothetical protein ACFLYN_02075 [Chloroflexota bacterium]
MKFWRTQRSEERKSPSQKINLHTGTDNIEQKILWLLVCVTYNQILLGNDLYLCVNELGEMALMMLPDLEVSETLGKIFYEQPHPSVVLVQHSRYGKDQSYLAPALLTNEQSLAMTAITYAFNSGKLEKDLKKYDWEKIIKEVIVNNSNYFNTGKHQHRISRITIADVIDTRQSDDSQRISGYNREIPVFMYFGLNKERKLNRQEMQRELVSRQLLYQENIDFVRNSLKTSPVWHHLDENDAFVHVINRAEVEIKLNMKSWPSFADLLLDPKLAEYNPGPPPGIKFTPKGVDLFKKTKSRELIFSLLNWGEPNIAQVSLHVIKVKGQSPKDGVTAPSITIFKDEMGIHSLQAKLFRVSTASFSFEGEIDSPVLLDAVPASQIPEISWEPIDEEMTSEWWQTDTIAKKVIWLAAYNLASHSIGDPEEVIYAVTPIGSDVIQVALVFDDLEDGTPYAFAVINDKSEIKAIPIFPTGTFESLPDGSLVTKNSVFLKNYCVTRNGERIDLQSSGQTMQFIRPIYATVISGSYDDPKIYGTL